MRQAPGRTVSERGRRSRSGNGKDFLRFYIATSRGKIDENERHRADSVNAFAERFFAGFTRITGTPTDEGDRSEVYNESALH